MTLTDAFGRKFEYLRLSVDEACNYRCVYCLPDGYKKEEPEPPLGTDEIVRLVTAFAEIGFWKIRLTGGEPTTRRDIVEIAARVAAAPGVRRLAISTNGYRLAELAEPLQRAGVQAVNVSLDSLDADRFAKITGRDDFRKVVAGIEACLTEGLETKLNVVLLRSFNMDDYEGFLRFAAERRIEVRFIELMQTLDRPEFFQQNHLSAEHVLELLRENGWQEVARRPGDGPARRFRSDAACGTVGVIAPYSRDFCTTCNRLRVTSRGALRLCLFSEGQTSLRRWLQKDSQRAELQDQVRLLLGRKEVSHYLPDGKTGDVKNFAMMGG